MRAARLRLTEKPGLFAEHRHRIYGLLAGIGVGLLLVLLFGAYFFDEARYLVGTPSPESNATPNASLEDAAQTAVAQVVKVRCPFCSGLCDETAHTCEHCGGKL